MATATVVCVNAETGAEVVDQALNGASTFIEAEAGVALSCSVTTVILINGSGQAPTTTASTTVTPEEAITSGLPIWLLYQATQ
jgi:C4-dicarboxylate transporter